MKLRCLITTIALAMMTTSAYAQHGHAGDVEFGYDDISNPTGFEIEHDEFTSDGLLFYESEFEELDPFNPGDWSSDEPGFTTASAEGLLVNENDQIWLQAMDASSNSSFGVGYVNFYNPVTDSLEAVGRLGVLDNSASTSDLTLNGAGIESGENPQFIGLGDDEGDVHDHLIVDLLDDSTAAVGAYGVLFTLQSDFATADGTMDLTSDPFWVIWNYGMDEEDFDEFALPKYGAVEAVPEPATISMFAIGMAAIMMRRRRRA
ncbi:MAG: PEP-CTERM sorting domain-containing protein [Mariniblastus sp.]|nr:PEP-CTERM sorting domain-containing protein [Mariniblastus sp.]